MPFFFFLIHRSSISQRILPGLLWEWGYLETRKWNNFPKVLQFILGSFKIKKSRQSGAGICTLNCCAWAGQLINHGNPTKSPRLKCSTGHICHDSANIVWGDSYTSFLSIFLFTPSWNIEMGNIFWSYILFSPFLLSISLSRIFPVFIWKICKSTRAYFILFTI